MFWASVFAVCVDLEFPRGRVAAWEFARDLPRLDLVADPGPSHQGVPAPACRIDKIADRVGAGMAVTALGRVRMRVVAVRTHALVGPSRGWKVSKQYGHNYCGKGPEHFFFSVWNGRQKLILAISRPTVFVPTRVELEIHFRELPEFAAVRNPQF